MDIYYRTSVSFFKCAYSKRKKKEVLKIHEQNISKKNVFKIFIH